MTGGHTKEDMKTLREEIFDHLKEGRREERTDLMTDKKNMMIEETTEKTIEDSSEEMIVEMITGKIEGEEMMNIEMSERQNILLIEVEIETVVKIERCLHLLLVRVGVSIESGVKNVGTSFLRGALCTTGVLTGGIQGIGIQGIGIQGIEIQEMETQDPLRISRTQARKTGEDYLNRQWRRCREP
jgi:hypothetical protein